MATADRYAEIRASHRWDVPPEFNLAHACCTRWADDRSRFALYWEDEDGARASFTFWDLSQQANRLSNALVAAGVRRGDKVALILPQRPETAIAHIAVYQAGAIAVPLSFLFGPEALEYRLQHSDAKIALPTPDACNGTRLPSLTIVRIISRHCTWSMKTASVPSMMPRLAVSPDCSISRRMYAWLCVAKSRFARKLDPTVNACRPMYQSPRSPA